MNNIMILVALVLVAVLVVYNQTEHMTDTTPTDAIHHLAGLYNEQKITVTNLNVIGWKGMIAALCDGTPDLRDRFMVGASIT